MTSLGCYVYGVVPEDGARPEAVEDLPAVANPEAKVTFVPHRGIAAIVSEVPVDRQLGTPEDLHAHARVLDTLAAMPLPVLPFRFGTVLKDAQSVTDELLAVGRDDFAAGLRRLEGTGQFTLKARYEQDEVLREVLVENPDIRQLGEELRGVPEETGQQRRIQLGQMVAEAVAAKREADTEEILSRLGPLALASTTAEATTEDGIVDASFLVEHKRSEAFEQAAEDLARDWHGRVRLRLLGPLAPYDFVDEALTEPAEGR